MSWSLDTSVPYVSESNGVIERQNGIVFDGLRTLLDNAGLAPQFWPLAGECFCDATNVGAKDPEVEHGLDRNCPYFRRFNVVWEWKRIPFGALVDFIPDEKWQRENVPKAAARAVPGIFLGYAFQDRGRFRRKYRVCPLSDFDQSGTGLPKGN